MDVLDVFVRAGQSISRGDQVTRSYRCVFFLLLFLLTCASWYLDQLRITRNPLFSTYSLQKKRVTLPSRFVFPPPIKHLNIFSKFVTDANVQLCGTLSLSTSTNKLPSSLSVVADHQNEEMSREIQVSLAFLITQIKIKFAGPNEVWRHRNQGYSYRSTVGSGSSCKCGFFHW